MTLVILFLVNVFNFYDRLTLGAIAVPLRREFHLSDAQIGGLSTGFTVLYAIAGWPLGRMADTKSRKGLLVWGVAIWSGLTALGGLASSYGMLLATRLGVGIGEAVCAPAATSWIGDAVKPERRTRAMAWFMMAVPVGLMLSFSLGGPASQAFGWRVALALAALPAVALIPALLSLREPLRTSVAATNVSPRALASIPAFWWIALSGAILNFALYSLTLFFPTFLTRYHHLSVAQAGIWAGIGLGISGIAGALLAGFIGDRAGGNLGRARMRLAAVASFCAAPLAFAGIATPAGAAALAIGLIVAANAFFQMYYGLVYAAMHDIVPPNLRGSAMGAYFAVQYLGGAAWGPLLTGRLSDHFAHAATASGAAAEAASAIGLHQAMYVIPALALVLGVVLWAGAFAARQETPIVTRL